MAIYAANRANFRNFIELGTGLQGDLALSDSQLEKFNPKTVAQGGNDKLKELHDMLKAEAKKEEKEENDGGMLLSGEDDNEGVSLYVESILDQEFLKSCQAANTHRYELQYEAAKGPEEAEDFFEFTGRYSKMAHQFHLTFQEMFECKAAYLVQLNKADKTDIPWVNDEFDSLKDYIKSAGARSNLKLVTHMQFEQNQ